MEQNRRRMFHVSLIWIGLTIGVGGLVYGCVRLGDAVKSPKVMTSIVEVNHDDKFQLPRMRLNRDVIPSMNLGRYNTYGKIFCDMNDEQLCMAKANGIKDLERVDEMIASSQLFKLTTNELYVMDSLTHSRPYLIPQAALMLNYVGLRFQEVLAEQNKDGHDYRFVVTSVLRSGKDVKRLRRTNGNASENSCHVYGTTIDISYIRYMRDDGEMVNEWWLKEVLAQALYELRYEGICYVRYERKQGCFHITVRDTEYRGGLASSMYYYDENNGIQPELMAFLEKDERIQSEVLVATKDCEEVKEKEITRAEQRALRREERKEERDMRKALAQEKREMRKLERIDVKEPQQEIEKDYAKQLKHNTQNSRGNYVAYPEQPSVSQIKEKQVKAMDEKRNSTYVSEYVGF